MTRNKELVGAVVLAAGLSRRMGTPKMLLDWQGGPMIAQVVQTLLEGGLERVMVVTGFGREQIEAALAGLPVEFAYNEQYSNGEMLFSLQTGLRALPAGVAAALIVLGDQPQIQANTVRLVLDRYFEEGGQLIVPSYQMRRGHPWLVERKLWEEILALRRPQTLRDFIQARAEDIQYLNVDTITILQDIDTPEDYNRFSSKE